MLVCLLWQVALNDVEISIENIQKLAKQLQVYYISHSGTGCMLCIVGRVFQAGVHSNRTHQEKA